MSQEYKLRKSESNKRHYQKKKDELEELKQLKADALASTPPPPLVIAPPPPITYEFDQIINKIVTDEATSDTPDAEMDEYINTLVQNQIKKDQDRKKKTSEPQEQTQTFWGSVGQQVASTLIISAIPMIPRLIMMLRASHLPSGLNNSEQSQARPLNTFTTL